ncbi:MAG: hypothetical protein ACD_28C00045G0002 [uncultured bacterium]|nr:MAG: hypothetical protein ACD_28C00045G0002 [uncultured bacterium]KKT76867.1 MAG: hypothetical protein UW70_C0010G0009 [Candidatus Peregrinibacteria bacterium GW2011_GWA2_44_7]
MKTRHHLAALLKSYPIPQVNPHVLDFALFRALKPHLNLWPLLIGIVAALSLFGGVLGQVALDYSSGLFSLSAYLSASLSVVAAALVTLMKLFMTYGNLLMAVSVGVIGLELGLNRKMLVHHLSTPSSS